MADGRVKRVLSKRERQILQFASEGLTNQEIASKLKISPNTVVTYWARIKMKYGKWSRTELVAMALREEAQETYAENKHLQVEIKKRENLEKRLREKEAMLRLILNQIPSLLWITDQDLIIRVLTGGDSQMLPKDTTDYIGEHVSSILSANSEKDANEWIGAHKAALKSKSATYRVNNPNGCYDVNIEPFKNESGQVTGCIALACISNN